MSEQPAFKHNDPADFGKHHWRVLRDFLVSSTSPVADAQARSDIGRAQNLRAIFELLDLVECELDPQQLDAFEQLGADVSQPAALEAKASTDVAVPGSKDPKSSPVGSLTEVLGGSSSGIHKRVRDESEDVESKKKARKDGPVESTFIQPDVDFALACSVPTRLPPICLAAKGGDPATAPFQLQCLGEPTLRDFALTKHISLARCIPSGNASVSVPSTMATSGSVSLVAMSTAKLKVPANFRALTAAIDTWARLFDWLYGSDSAAAACAHTFAAWLIEQTDYIHILGVYTLHHIVAEKAANDRHTPVLSLGLLPRIMATIAKFRLKERTCLVCGGHDHDIRNCPRVDDTDFSDVFAKASMPSSAVLPSALSDNLLTSRVESSLTLVPTGLSEFVRTKLSKVKLESLPRNAIDQVPVSQTPIASLSGNQPAETSAKAKPTRTAGSSLPSLLVCATPSTMASALGAGPTIALSPTFASDVTAKTTALSRVELPSGSEVKHSLSGVSSDLTALSARFPTDADLAKFDRYTLISETNFRFDTIEHCFHSYCPRATILPAQIDLSYFDPPLIPYAREFRHSCLEANTAPFSLDIALIAQIKSVRPEQDGRIYCDWFSRGRKAICRRSTDSAYSFRWQSAWWSWIQPPLCTCCIALIVAKFIADKSVGTIVLPHRPAASWFTVLEQRASILFYFTDQSQDLVAFVVDTLPLGPIERFNIESPDPSLLRVPTCPLSAAAFYRGLAHFPNQDLVRFVCNGINWGHTLGYKGPRTIARACSNPRSFSQNLDVLLPIFAKDEAKSWRSGPYPITQGKLPLFNLICSPMRAAFKRFSGKPRLVNNLSYPYDSSAVNMNINRACQRNTSIKHVADLVLHFGRGTLLFEFDAVSAYKIPVLIPDDWHVQGELTADGASWSTVPDFGAKSSGTVWDKYGTAAEFVVRHYAQPDAISRYVDNFLQFTQPKAEGVPDTERSTEQAARTLLVCDELQFPVSGFKGPTTKLIHLGWEIDTMQLTLSTTPERRQFTLDELKRWTQCKSATCKQLLSLAGQLQFIGQAFAWSKPYLGNILRLAHAPNVGTRRLTLPAQCHEDISWWYSFITHWSGTTLLHETLWTQSSVIGFEVDACDGSFGCWCDPDWFAAPFPDWVMQLSQRDKRQSMPFKELFAFATALMTFGSRFQRLRLICYSDCQGAVDVINRRRAHTPGLSSLLRAIAHCVCIHSLDIRAEHVPGKRNIRADLLSRLRVNDFLSQTPHAASLPTVPSDLRTLL